MQLVYPLGSKEVNVSQIQDVTGHSHTADI